MSETLPVAAEPMLPALLRPVASPATLIQAHQDAVQLVAKVLEEGKDYGIIPGTGDKPTLLKPGAERLLASFGTYADTVVLEHESDHDRLNEFTITKWESRKKRPSKEEADELKEAKKGRWRKTNDGGWEFQDRMEEEGSSRGLYRYVVKCNIVHRQTGNIVASGVGSCSTMESKYIRSPRDYENTVLKMAKKRAMVDATLNAFGLSDRFTQDVEDIAPEGPPERQKDGDRLEAETFLRNIYGATNGKFSEFAKSDMASLKDLAKARGSSFMPLVKEAMEAGALNPEQLRSYIEDGTLVGSEQPAEVVQTAPLDEYDPFADTDEASKPEVVEGELVEA